MKLWYVMDPMCSWCWGFRPVFKALLTALPPIVEVRYVMGGLAPDTDAPMPIETRAYIQDQWRAVAAKTGAEFNWEFWEHCQPRRATYPACRAVIAAGLQDSTMIPNMIEAIQKAYYLQARNPSDDGTLIVLAEEIGLDPTQFQSALNSDQVHNNLKSDFKQRDELGVTSFPTLLAQIQQQVHWLASGSTNFSTLLSNAHTAGLPVK